MKNLITCLVCCIIAVILLGCAERMPSVDPVPKVENCAKGKLCVPDTEKRVIKRVADNQ